MDDEMGARHETCSALNCDPRAAPGCGCGSLIDALFTGAIPCAGGAGSFEDFADNPIPADFFGPGSDPFTELVCLKGEPLGNTVFGVFDTADTLILRSDNPFECDAPFPDIGVVDIEIVELHLVSIDPIVVTFNGGQTPELWDVEVELSDLDQPIGSMTVQKTHDNGGTFTADLPVLPKITFTQVANPGNIQVLDFGLAGLDPIGFTTQPTGWVHEVKLGTVKPEGGPSCFNPSIAEP
ncbi:MAG: hypothetical protein GY715_12380 [Planctomycetes bacterium]|nr:hypothetical protein [Planctomycetota bacterium]